MFRVKKGKVNGKCQQRSKLSNKLPRALSDDNNSGSVKGQKIPSIYKRNPWIKGGDQKPMRPKTPVLLQQHKANNSEFTFLHGPDFDEVCIGAPDCSQQQESKIIKWGQKLASI